MKITATISREDGADDSFVIYDHEQCIELGGVEPLSCFRAAQHFESKGQYLLALRVCVHGLVYDPSNVELMWLAGAISLKDKKYMNAISWSRMAVMASREFNCVIHEPIAHNEGPYMVLADAYRALGNMPEANVARRDAWSIMSARSAT